MEVFSILSKGGFFSFFGGGGGGSKLLKLLSVELSFVPNYRQYLYSTPRG